MAPAPLAGMFGILLSLLLGGGLGMSVGIPPLPEDPALLRVAPPESLVFVEWFGAGEADPGSANRTERLVASPEVRDFAAAIEKAIRRGIQEEGPRDAKAILDQGIDLLRTVASRPGCAFLSKVELGPEPSVSAGLVINAGDQAAEVGRVLRELESFLLREMGGGERAAQPRAVDVAGASFRALPVPPPAPPVAWGFAGEYLIVAVGQGTPEKIAGALKQGPGLDASPEFQKLRASVKVERPASRVFVNVAAILETIAPLGGPEVTAVLDALGLTSVTALVSESGLDGDGFASRTLVATRGVPSGLLRLVEGAPLSDEELAPIPADATLAAAMRLDALAIYKEFLAALGRIEPRAREEFVREVAGELEEEFGIDLEDDVLRPLGTGWCVWNSPGEGGLVVTGLTLAVPVKDRAKLEAAMEKLIDAARQEMGPRRGSQRRTHGVFVESIAFQGKKIWFLNSVGEEMPVAPAWCLTDRHLLVSPFPQMIKSAIARGAAPGSSILENAAVKGRGTAHGLLYVDARETFRTLYPALLPLATVLCSEIQREGVDLSVAALPSASAILPHLGPELSTVERTERGILLASRGTLPAGGAVSLAAVPAVAAAILMPIRMHSARGVAEESMMMAELRQLQTAIEMYKLDHGRGPDTLEQLWTGESPMVRERPSAPHGGEFEYFGASDDPERPVLLSPPTGSGTRAVLFGDGSMLTIPEHEAQTMRERARRAAEAPAER